MSDLIKQLKFDKVDVQIVAEASLVKEEALLASKTIETVDDVFEASYAHKALKTLKNLITQIETSRKSVKAPILDVGRNIDNLAKDYIHDVKLEEQRISKLLGAYQRIERDKKVAAQREAMIEENKIMVEQAQKAAESGDLAQPIDDNALAKINQLREQVAEKHDAVAGVKVRTTTKFEIVDEAELLAARPDLFSPDQSKIRHALKLTKTIPGVKTWEETKAY